MSAVGTATIRGGATLLYSLLGIAAASMMWTAVHWIWQPPEYLFPPLSLVLSAALQNWDGLIFHAWITGYEVLLGFAAASVAGFAGAIVLHARPAAGRVLWPVVLFAQITPQIAFAPLLIMIFGIGLTTKIVLAALIAFFPVLVNAYVGLEGTDEATEDLARAMGAGRIRYFLEFELPNALPHILSGLKIAMTYAVVGAVVAEFLSSNEGLGNLILVANGTLDAALALAAVLMLSIMGVILFAGVSLVERLLIPWHISQRRSAQLGGAL